MGTKNSDWLKWTDAKGECVEVSYQNLATNLERLMPEYLGIGPYLTVVCAAKNNDKFLAILVAELHKQSACTGDQLEQLDDEIARSLPNYPGQKIVDLDYIEIRDMVGRLLRGIALVLYSQELIHRFLDFVICNELATVAPRKYIRKLKYEDNWRYLPLKFLENVRGTIEVSNLPPPHIYHEGEK